MSTTLIITGLVLFVIGLSVKSCNKPATEPVKVETKPKSNDHRIVQCPDGGFQIEYFYEYPGWHLLSRDLKTLDEAKARLGKIEGGRESKVVWP